MPLAKIILYTCSLVLDDTIRHFLKFFYLLIYGLIPENKDLLQFYTEKRENLAHTYFSANASAKILKQLNFSERTFYFQKG